MNTRISEWHEGIALPQAFIVTSAPEASRPMTDGPDVDRRAVVLEPRRHLGEVLARQVGDGVQHVGAGVEQEPAAGQSPAPGATCPSVSVAQFCQATALMLRIGPSSPERSSRDASRTCGDRLPWNATTSSRPVRSRVAISASASVGGHHHRLLEEDVEPGLETGRRLGEVEGVGRDDERRRRAGGRRGDEPLPVGLVGRSGEAVAGEQLAACA